MKRLEHEEVAAAIDDEVIAYWGADPSEPPTLDEVIGIAASWVIAKLERVADLLAAEHEGRKLAQRYVGSLPLEVGDWFDRRMADLDAAYERDRDMR